MYRLLWLLGLGLLAGCSAAAGPDMTMPPPAVTVSFALEKTVTDFGEFTGRLAAVDMVQLRARVWGTLDKINFTEGAEVNEKDLLFVIDPRPYQATLARADAAVAEAEARQNRLANDHSRAQSLLQNRAISREEFEKSAGDLTEAQSAVRSALAARLAAKLNLEFTEVRAPIRGQIGRAMVTVGNVVTSGESGGTVLTSIVSTDPVHAYFDVDDLVASRIQRLLRDAKSSGSDRPRIFMGLAHEKGFPHVGELDFSDNQIDPSTGTLRMRGVFPNPRRVLTPGLFVRVRVPLDNPHPAVLVADRAIDSDQGQKVVFIVGLDDKVVKRDVRLGRLHGGLRELTDGVRPGERVIIDGLQRVRHGVPVVPTVIDMPAPPDMK